MTDINWNIFKVKFNGKEDRAFEQLAYLLFCAEHGIVTGIFRFKNQTGIETEPINLNGQEIGFQAKYYDARLSDNKDDIIESLSKAKNKNPDLTKILLYTNQELSESTKKSVKKPQYLVEIEKIAGEIGITLEWRVPSHIEHQLSLPANHHLAEFFFSLGKNIVDFLDELKAHAENILLPIQSSIPFAGTDIKIDRKKIMDDIENTVSAVTIIGGTGGSGKTALIKDFFQKTAQPLYVFKAAEFSLPDINSLFKRFGEFTLNDFLKAHEAEALKIVVVDSAEKLADLEDQEAFKEFISALIRNKWHILFTTRHSYLDDLNFQLVEIYRLPFSVITIGNLNAEELSKLAETYGFNLPSDHKLLKLIENLFYLDEYLALYNSLDSKTNIIKFKHILWQKKIQNSKVKKNNIHLERERVFLQIAKSRCETGHFYIKADNLDNTVLALLAAEEIIQYEENQDGYFITHDIYEEWALDKLIEREFGALTSYEQFFTNIGTSLAIRRAFRFWLSDKLAIDINLVKTFIEQVFSNTTIENFWKDELLISVLLADYSQDFFAVFGKLLLENNKAHLKKIIFLLRTACKEIDSFYYQTTAILDEVTFDKSYLLTRPKGKGWVFAIEFINQNLDQFGIQDLPFILPLLLEWNSNNRMGPATKAAALFALHFYNKSQEDGSYEYHRDKLKETLLTIVLTGTAEIKTELTAILDELMAGSLNDRRERYQDLLDSLLKAEDRSYQLIATMPDRVLQLAYKYWYQPADERHEFDYGGYGVEEYYSIPNRWHHDYFPASAFQTPIYWALQFDFPKTIEFILNFTNRAVEIYAASGYDDSVIEIDVYFDEKTKTKQYISNSLWNIYRGSGSPVSPYLIQSYHMALEKHLLRITKTADKKIVEGWLRYLLRKTRSASITAVVTSVVLAFAEDFFDLAATLFRTYEFLQYDNWRKMREYEAESIYKVGAGMNVKDRVHEKDRLDSVKDPHRKFSLEDHALQYQFFRSAKVTNEEAEHRLKVIGEIIDNYYGQLDAKDSQTDEDHTHRLLLARIDRRKMKPKIEELDDNKFVINFNPEIDPELEKQRQAAVSGKVDIMKYTALKLWATTKFEPDKSYGPYPQYDEGPELALKEVKEILEGLPTGDETYYLFNNIIPAYAAYALIKVYSGQLQPDDLLLCKNLIIEYATAPFRANYQYQIADGVEVAVNALPFLYPLFPEDRSNYDMILLCILFDTYPIGEYKRICDYAIDALNRNLYRIAPGSAIKVFRGYVAFKGKYDEINNPAHLKRQRTFGYRQSRPALLDLFTEKYESELQLYFDNQYPFPDIPESTDLKIVETAFQMIPIDSTEPVHLSFFEKSLPMFVPLLRDDRDHRREEPKDYKIRYRFFQRFAYFVLSRDKNDISRWVRPFVDGFLFSEEVANFLQEFISAEDRMQTYDTFWAVWDCFYDVIKNGANSGKSYYDDVLISNYLLAWRWWKETAKSWHSLRERERVFYSKVVSEMGRHPAVLYSIGKLINQIGSAFLGDSVIWVSDLLANNKNLYSAELVTNTIYYLEVLVRKYVYLNRTKLKTDRLLKNKLLVILEFLIDKGSVNAYLLREDIL
jgi:hypothetical protein